MRPQLSLEEIRDGIQFEELVAGYFRDLQAVYGHVGCKDVDVSGEGTDGGKDILVKLELNDGLTFWQRTWVVQCKFRGRSVSLADIGDHNIPALVHSYGAHGYLLVVRGKVTSKLSSMFERLRSNCRFGYEYRIWEGSHLVERLQMRTHLIQQFFPEHSLFLDSKKEKVK